MSPVRNHRQKDRQSCIYLWNRTKNTGCVAKLCMLSDRWADGCCLQVEQAVREIKRLLIEASAAALQAEMRNPSAVTGRYSVV